MFKYILILVILMTSGTSHATQNSLIPELSEQGLKAAGFEKIIPFLQKLTPEQKTAILQAVTMLQQQWAAMSKEQQTAFLKQIMEAYSKFDFSKADPAEMDTNKMQNMDKVQKDIESYNKSAR